ncbi:MAG: hypothetical protein JO134_03280 [Xanthobacteraceae bacterium]|nr:hypothetical protein [Xanthobacteraceae bacterium]
MSVEGQTNGGETAGAASGRQSQPEQPNSASSSQHTAATQAVPSVKSAPTSWWKRADNTVTFVKNLSIVGVLVTLIPIVFSAWTQFVSGREAEKVSAAKNDYQLAKVTLYEAYSAAATGINLQDSLYHALQGAATAADKSRPSTERSPDADGVRTAWERYEQAEANLRDNQNAIALKLALDVDRIKDKESGKGGQAIDRLASDVLGSANFDCDDNFPELDPSKLTPTPIKSSGSATGASRNIDFSKSKHQFVAVYYCFFVNGLYLHRRFDSANNANFDIKTEEQKLTNLIERLKYFSILMVANLEWLEHRAEPRGLACQTTGLWCQRKG